MSSSFDRKMRRQAERLSDRPSGSGNRAQRRRRQAGRGDGAPLLFHGTTALLADLIRTEGLRPGADGRVYLTDNLGVAQCYALWGASLAATVPVPHDFEPSSDIGRKAAEMGGAVAAVAHVRLPAGVQLHTEGGSSAPPPLPWHTVTHRGRAFYVRQPIPAQYVRPFELWNVEELEVPGMLERVEADSNAIAVAFPRNFTEADTPAALAVGVFPAAIPDPDGLLAAISEAGGDQNAESLWHGPTHWLGVAVAGLRLIEAGCAADPAVVFAFAVLHDSQRRSEGRDPDHGARAADVARRLGAGPYLHLSGEQMETLRAALVAHDRGQISDDPTIGACWDADRLTLTRLGATVHPGKLSTDSARRLRAMPDSIPDPELCNWSWCVYRYTLAAASPPAARAEDDHVTLYHGTAYALDETIRREGLREPQGRRGPFLTGDWDRALKYGVRSAVWHAEETGSVDDRLIVYTVRCPSDLLRLDETEDDGSQHWVPGGVPPEWLIGWEAFDASDWITDRDELVASMRGAQNAEALRARLVGDAAGADAA